MNLKSSAEFTEGNACERAVVAAATARIAAQHRVTEPQRLKRRRLPAPDTSFRNDAS
jgi:hypothetical protein